MKTLYIIRHAKSSWSDPNLEDHDRPLNERGDKDKVVMSKFIRRHFGDIERIYSSSATRALDYAACINRHTNIPLEVSAELYTFSSEDLLGFIKLLPEHLSEIAVVVHNPAATEVVNHLSDLSADKKLTNLPTGAVIKLGLDSQTWRGLEPKSGVVIDFAKPKSLDSFEDDLD